MQKLCLPIFTSSWGYGIFFEAQLRLNIAGEEHNFAMQQLATELDETFEAHFTHILSVSEAKDPDCCTCRLFLKLAASWKTGWQVV